MTQPEAVQFLGEAVAFVGAVKHLSSEPEYTWSYARKEEEPSLFYEICEIVYKRDKEHIETSRTALLEKGVPEKYIFVCQTNRHDKQGDLYPYCNTQRVEDQLNCIRDCDPPIIVTSEGAYRFICVDLRERDAILERCNFCYIKEVLDEFLANIEERTLEFDKEKTPDAYRRQKQLNRLKASNEVLIQYGKIKKQLGCPDEYVFVAHTKRNDPSKTGEIIPYTDKNRLISTLDTLDKGTTVCHYPADDIFTCLDICDLQEVRKYISPESISDNEIDQIVCGIKQLALHQSGVYLRQRNCSISLWF